MLDLDPSAETIVVLCTCCQWRSLTFTRAEAWLKAAGHARSHDDTADRDRALRNSRAATCRIRNGAGGR